MECLILFYELLALLFSPRLLDGTNSVIPTMTMTPVIKPKMIGSVDVIP